MLNEVKRLPDSMEVDELKEYFLKFLENVEHSNLDLEEISYILRELAYRQYDTLEVLDFDIKVKIDKLVCEICNFQSAVVMNNIILIVANLGLEESYKLLRNSLNQEINDGIRSKIQVVINHIGENISDPYINYMG